MSQLIERGYTMALASQIVEGNVLLETLDLVELGVIADTIHKVDGNYTVSLNRYLEEAEIKQVNEHKIKQEKEDKDVLVFEDVRQVADDIWTVVVPCQKIGQLYRNHAVEYDFDTQRDPKNIEVGDSILKVANVNAIAVAEIQDLLIRGLFIPNTITFNIPIEKSDYIRYDKPNNRIVLTEKVLSILDGYHRSLGIVGALRVNPGLNYNFEIRITNFDTDKARQFIVQEDKRNPINKEYIRSIDENDRITSIVNSLNQSNKSELQGMITSDRTLITSGHALVRFDLMHGVVDKLWNPTTMLDNRKITEALIKTFNQIVGFFPNEFKLHIRRARQTSHLSREQMFLFYTVLAKEIEDSKDWDDDFYNVISEVIDNAEAFKDLLDMAPSTLIQNLDEFIDLSKNIIEGVLNNGQKTV